MTTSGATMLLVPTEGPPLSQLVQTGWLHAAILSVVFLTGMRESPGIPAYRLRGNFPPPRHRCLLKMQPVQAEPNVCPQR